MDLFELVQRNIVVEQTATEHFVPYNVWSNAHASAFRVKAGPALLFGFTVYNSNAAAQFILVFDSQVAPAAGAVAGPVFKVAGASNVTALWVPPRTHTEGIWLVNSSTEPTLTAGAADCSFDAQYI